MNQRPGAGKATWIAIAMATALALAGCGGRGGTAISDPAHATPVALGASAANAATLTTLYRQALRAGHDRVVVYSTTGAAEWEPLWRTFAHTFPGLDVTYSHITPSQVITRIHAEEVSGRRFGDVFLLPVNIAPTVAGRGYFQPYSPPTLAALPVRFRDRRGLIAYPFEKVFGLAYNTRLVKVGTLPPDLDGVLAPRWRKQFTYIQPGSINGTSDVGIALMRARGQATPAQLQGLHRDGSFAGIEAGVTYVSEGRQELQLWAYLPTVMRQRSLGAPVDIAFTPDFSVLVPFAAAISRDAPDPDIARLFVAWLFSEGAQAALARDVAMAPTMPGAPRPALYAPAQQRAILETQPPPAKMAATLKAQQPELKRIFSAPSA